MFEGVSHIAEIWIFVALGVMVILFLISGMARLYRKAGPHEALIVLFRNRPSLAPLASRLNGRAACHRCPWCRSVAVCHSN